MVRPVPGIWRQGAEIRPIFHRNHFLITGRRCIDRYVARAEPERDGIGIARRDHEAPSAIIDHGAPAVLDRPADQASRLLEIIGRAIPDFTCVLDPPRFPDRERKPHRGDEPVGIDEARNQDGGPRRSPIGRELDVGPALDQRLASVAVDQRRRDDLADIRRLDRVRPDGALACRGIDLLSVTLRRACYVRVSSARDGGQNQGVRAVGGVPDSQPVVAGGARHQRYTAMRAAAAVFVRSM